MTFCLACIVEGHGDVGAVPILLRRIAAELAPAETLAIPHPIRIPRNRLIRQGELERAVELAARQVRQSGSPGGVLILFDSDDDCPARLGPALLARARLVRDDIPLSVVLAKREFESWFLAAATSLLGEQVTAPGDPEEIRGAKEWLAARMKGKYVETLDQSRFAAGVNLLHARRSHSFDRLYRVLSRLLDLQ